MPNPKPKAYFTKENAREMQLRGCEVRKKNNAERKKLKETFDVLMKKSVRKGRTMSPEELKSLADAEGKNIDIQTAIAISAVQRALKGDVQATQFIRDTLGEKPSDKVELDQSVTIEKWAKEHKVKL